MEKTLIEAVDAGNLQGVLRLVQEGADINASYQGDTPLVKAIKNGYVSIVDKLLAMGAKINDAATANSTYEFVMRKRYDDILWLLLAYNIDFDIKALQECKNYNIFAPLLEAASEVDSKVSKNNIIEMLIKNADNSVICCRMIIKIFKVKDTKFIADIISCLQGDKRSELPLLVSGYSEEFDETDLIMRISQQNNMENFGLFHIMR